MSDGDPALTGLLWKELEFGSSWGHALNSQVKLIWLLILNLSRCRHEIILDFRDIVRIGVWMALVASHTYLVSIDEQWALNILNLESESSSLVKLSPLNFIN